MRRTFLQALVIFVLLLLPVAVLLLRSVRGGGEEIPPGSGTPLLEPAEAWAEVVVSEAVAQAGAEAWFLDPARTETERRRFLWHLVALPRESGTDVPEAVRAAERVLRDWRADPRFDPWQSQIGSALEDLLEISRN
ncbi:MAG: hypothetical protein ACOC3I_04600 [Verrucomicrobiota bacterium]